MIVTFYLQPPQPIRLKAAASIHWIYTLIMIKLFSHLFNTCQLCYVVRSSTCQERLEYFCLEDYRLVPSLNLATSRHMLKFTCINRVNLFMYVITGMPSEGLQVIIQNV